MERGTVRFALLPENTAAGFDLTLRAMRRAPRCGAPRGLAIEEGEESYAE